MKAVEETRKQEYQDNMVKGRDAEIRSLQQKMPEWKDPAKAEAAMKVAHTYLNSMDFSDEEIAALSDHRYLLVAHEAAQWRNLKKQAPKKIEKLRGLPKPKKVLRTGARRDSNLDALKVGQRKYDKLRETGDDRDAAALFEEMFS